MAGGGGSDGESLDYTPTWIIALVCTVIVAISLIVERLRHYAGKFLIKKNQGALFEALQKIKEELMLLGFISLLLTGPAFLLQQHHHQMAWDTGADLLRVQWGQSPPLKFQIPSEKSSNKHWVFAPLLSYKAVHDLHIFIFVLAVALVIFSALTILFGTLKIRQWKQWEDSIQKKEHDTEQAQQRIVTHVQEHGFIKRRFKGIGKNLITLTPVIEFQHSFFKQFYGSVNEENPNFNFYKYMTRALETDFKEVVGISWYLWIFVVLFLLLNVKGWHAYFWIAFIPLILLLIVGTELEHIITQLAEEVGQRHTAITGDLVVRPSDDHFWFHKPRLVLVLIHIILFQNSFEIAVFFWMLVIFKFNTCILGEVGYVIPRLVIGYIYQGACAAPLQL
ncbi:MLO 1 [Olea europaea subsp. europaea]|uniref:MLO 1 n=1 Tax=Olea europaea subsp. europaea TaxID=158383 RepID=A0A8S0PXD3_OLEEU|nr:MLO 1 [Olea europaea subsp. europaea]